MNTYEAYLNWHGRNALIVRDLHCQYGDFITGPDELALNNVDAVEIIWARAQPSGRARSGTIRSCRGSNDDEGEGGAYYLEVYLAGFSLLGWVICDYLGMRLTIGGEAIHRSKAFLPRQ